MRKSANKDRGNDVAQGKNESKAIGKPKTTVSEETSKSKEIAQQKATVESKKPVVAEEPAATTNKADLSLKPSAVARGQSWVREKEEEKEKATESGSEVEKTDPSTSGPVKEVAARLDTRVANEQAQRGKVQVKAVRAVDDRKGKRVVEEQKVREVEFCWNACSASCVQLTGSFNDWKEKIEMAEVEGIWKVSMELKKGRHFYKFVVDGKWCYDIRKENETDDAGNVNNVITV